MLYTDLPAEVRAGVADLARRVRALGGRLFVFGSFATGTARPTSDLDLALDLPKGVSGTDEQQLLQAVEALPTVRPIDLLNLSRADDTFRRQLVRIEISVASS